MSVDERTERLSKRPRRSDNSIDSHDLQSASPSLPRFTTGLSNEEKTKVLMFILPGLQTLDYRDIVFVATEHDLKRATRAILMERLRCHVCTLTCMIRTADAIAAGIVPPPINYETPVVRTRQSKEPQVEGFSPEQKTHVLKFVLPSLDTLVDREIAILAKEHNVKKGPRHVLLENIRAHTCISTCAIRTADAIAAGLMPAPSGYIAPTRKFLKVPLLNNHSRQQDGSRDAELNRQRDREDRQYWENNWPQVELPKVLKQILRESRLQTSGDALRRQACSFCDRNEVFSTLKQWKVEDLDISLLEAATERFRSLIKHPALKEQPPIRSHHLTNGKYYACSTCARCTKNDRFFKVPLLSWANGCWIGSTPKELMGLTYLEELVIARAHTTKCWAKLNQGKGPMAQRAASGNVCIHPHEITDLANRLPRPISTLYDEIVIMFVSNDQPALPDIFKRTPFIVRRGRILRALNWLKGHNRFYHDIQIDRDALKEYPDEEHDDGCVPFPVQTIPVNDTTRGQNATYTGHGMDDNETLFATEPLASIGQIPMSVTGTFDVDSAELALDIQKIRALRHIKSNGTYVKTSTSDETLQTRANSHVYCLLWPTLFPYGVGMFEDSCREKPIFSKKHVQHYLGLSDRRFQTHLSFIFVMHNIQMLRRSSFQSRLALRRSWWPSAMSAMEKIDDTTLEEVLAKLTDRKARKDYSKWDPSTPAEEAVRDLLKYVDYVTDHIEGSTAEVMSMREEIHALCRHSGTPSVFYTLNPADNHNPLMAFTAGRDIDVDALFDKPDSRYTPFDRARILADNPVAGAEFFKIMVDQFTDVFLGFKRAMQRGVFGRVKHYYGVVEAQARGSLHLHILVWLEGALSPRRIQDRANEDVAFKQRLFDWLDSVFVHDLPTRTTPVNGDALRKRQCILGRPPHPDSPDFDARWPQYLREVLDTSGQTHRHSDTCFKKTSYSMLSLSVEDRDKLCRFNLPEKPVVKTFMDEDGKIHMKRTNGSVVGYTPILSGAFQCNTDSKFVGSGPFGMALSIYMCNYTAKASLDSAIIMSALSAATKSMKEAKDPSLMSFDKNEERCRRMLLKTLNQINGRRELSAQQVACALTGIPNHVTSARFAVFYWSKLLFWLSPKEFPRYIPHPEVLGMQAPHPIHPDVADDDDEGLNIHIDGQHDLVLLSNEPVPPGQNSLVYDVLLRPAQLEDTCMWDQFSQYEIVPLSKAKRKRANIPGNDEESDDWNESDVHAHRVIPFLPGHPQVDSCGLRKRRIPHIPVLSGYPIPRRDLPSQADKYAIVMLSLFKPWRRSGRDPLKDGSISWADALHTMLQSLPRSKLDVIDHMQEQWECRLAADDYSSQQKIRLSDFQSGQSISFGEDIEGDRYANDIAWQLGQVTSDNLDHNASGEYSEPEDYDDFQESGGARGKASAEAAINLARSAQCYEVGRPVPLDVTGRVKEADHAAREIARTALRFLLAERAVVQKGAYIDQECHVYSQDRIGNVKRNPTRSNKPPNHERHDPKVTTLEDEIELAKAQFAMRHKGTNHTWSELERWKRTAIAVANQFTLNTRQKLAFLLIIDSRMNSSRQVNRTPSRMIIGGPGGTGKSHIYDALRAFYHEFQLESELKFTAPTGIAALNVRGSTIHSETCINTRDKTLMAQNSKPMKAMVERFRQTKTLVIDEFFFMGCGEFEKMSRNLQRARGCHDDAFGDLDVLLSGDEYQLVAPGVEPLFSHRYVSNDGVLQAQNPKVHRNFIAMKNYWSIDTCVVLDEVVRQRNPRYVALLNRLRHGTCTISGHDNDLDYLKRFRLGRPDSRVAPFLTDVNKWIGESRKGAAPLITYTNSVRNAHNWHMTKAFASATSQPFHVYYAEDAIGSGTDRIVLQGQNAQDAWDTPIKSLASDLSGRLPLVIGLPIFVVANLAVELGVAKGSSGTLTSIDYEVKRGRRYATSAEVDLSSYTSPDPEASFPHRVRIPIIKKPITFAKKDGKKMYTARRAQLPIIPAFAYTAHNSQSRSLNAGIVHLESCVSIAASYVMLSRIKCDEHGPKGLAILGEVYARNIHNHAPEEVRNEEKRLKRLAQATLTDGKIQLEWYTRATGHTW